MNEVKCPWCNRGFYPDCFNKIFCSPKCEKLLIEYEKKKLQAKLKNELYPWYKKKREVRIRLKVVICKFCKLIFVGPFNKKYCSPRCRDLYKRQKRPEIFLKECEICGDKEQIEDHHIIPQNERNSDGIKIPLCKKHHKIITKYLKKIREMGYRIVIL